MDMLWVVIVVAAVAGGWYLWKSGVVKSDDDVPPTV
jgi:hypothetical protein